jgi:hypothetical protein
MGRSSTRANGLSRTGRSTKSCARSGTRRLPVRGTPSNLCALHQERINRRSLAAGCCQAACIRFGFRQQPSPESCNLKKCSRRLWGKRSSRCRRAAVCQIRLAARRVAAQHAQLFTMLICASAAFSPSASFLAYHRSLRHRRANSAVSLRALSSLRFGFSGAIHRSTLLSEPTAESQVRRRLSAGGRWIRTLGPP